MQPQTTDHPPHQRPDDEVVPLAQQESVLPYNQQARATPQEHAERIAARQAAVAARMLG
jgi:hypothetical protein